MSVPFNLLAPQDVLESFYANVQRSRTIHMVMLDTAGLVVATNRAAAQLFGTTPDQLVGESWFELAIPESRRAEVRGVFDKLLATGLPEVYQNDIALPDGSTRTMIWSNSLMHTGEKLTGVVSFGIDITEQSRAHTALQEERHMLSRAETIAGLGTYILDATTGVWSSSAVLDGIFGITDIYPRTVRGWLDIVHPEDRDMMSDYFTGHVLAQHQPFDKVYRIVRRTDGATRTVHGFGELEIGPGGKVSRMLGTIQDITDVVELRTKLSATEERFTTLFNTAPEAIFLIKDGVFVDCNDATLGMFGCARDQIIGHSPQELSPAVQPDGKPSAASALEKISAALTGDIQRFRWKHRRCNGELFDVTVSLNRMQLNGVTHLQAIFRDETEHLAHVDALKKADERFRLAAYHAHALVYDWNIDDGSLSWEGTIKELTGYEPAEFPAVTVAGWTEMIHAEDRAAALELLDKARVTLSRYSTTYRLRRKEGTYFRVDDSGSFVTDASGKAVRMVGTIRDTTAMSSLESKYASLFQTMSEGFAEHDIITDSAGKPVDYRFLLINKAFEQMTGHSAAELVGKTVKQVFPNTEDVWIQRYGDVALTGKPAEFTSLSKDVGGKSFHVRAWSSQKNRFAVLFSDVTEAERRAGALQSVMDHAVEAIAIITPTGICTYQNAASLPMLGYQPEELVGKNLLTYINPSDLPRVTAQIAIGTANPSKPLDVKFQFKHKNGSWRSLETTGVNLISDPQVEGILIFSHDVTDILKGQEAIARNEELAALNKAMIGRELRITELKELVRKLSEELEKK